MMERLKSLLSLRPYPRIRSLMDFMRLRIITQIPESSCIPPLLHIAYYGGNNHESYTNLDNDALLYIILDRNGNGRTDYVSYTVSHL